MKTFFSRHYNQSSSIRWKTTRLDRGNPTEPLTLKEENDSEQNGNWESRSSVCQSELVRGTLSISLAAEIKNKPVSK